MMAFVRIPGSPRDATDVRYRRAHGIIKAHPLLFYTTWEDDRFTNAKSKQIMVNDAHNLPIQKALHYFIYIINKIDATASAIV